MSESLFSPNSLPERADLCWYRKAAKRRLPELQKGDPAARLADAQRVVAREAGFASWRKLRAAIEAQQPEPMIAADIGAFLRLVSDRDLRSVRASLDQKPALANEPGSHPMWGGRPTALHVAIERGDVAIAKLLLSRDASPAGDNAGYGHWTPLMLAAHWKRAEIVAAIRARLGRLTLGEALILGDDDAANRLLDGGERSVPTNDATPLHFARTGAIARRLITLGIPIDARDTYGQTALDQAAGAGLPDVAAALVAAGAAAAPTTWARLGDLARMRAALAGAAPGPDLILAAVAGRRVDVARWLLDQGLSVQTRQPKGSKGTLLHEAAFGGDVAMVKLLLERGADPAAIDEEHRTTPATWARVARVSFGRAGCAEVEAILGTGGGPQ